MNYETASIKHSWLDGNVGKVQANPNWKDFDDLPTSYRGWQTVRAGKAEGKVIGGNYSSFAQLYRTEYMPNAEGSVLFMECYKKNKKEIQQALTQLRVWGAYDKINGLVIGYCLGSDNPETFGNDRSMKELSLEATDGYDFPIMWIGEVGHNVENMILPIGANVCIDSSSLTLEIKERVVGQ